MLIAGTSSDAGKSAVVTGICRALSDRGISVAPFKAQNMSNNSMVCVDGAEIGRAQYLQAQAARVEPSALLNPVLLKPGSDRRSHIVLLGEQAGTLESGEYATGRKHLAQAAFDAYRQLGERYDVIVCEGAGSPAEINLRSGDYVNMGLARQFELPVMLVGDIDRGGVLASIYGTWGLLEEADRRLLSGFIINKFRGDQSVLDPGLKRISELTGLKNYGVLPWIGGVWTDGEDALEVARWRGESDSEHAQLRVAVVRFPRISNSTDVDALAAEQGVWVQVTTTANDLVDADLVVLPGSRATTSDLRWMESRGIDEVIRQRHAEGRPVLAICGGYEMLAGDIHDEVEGEITKVAGLGLLPVDVRFSREKTVRQASYQWRDIQVGGYEIHHGVIEATGEAEGFLDGYRVGNTFGTMLHGSLENDEFRRALLGEVAEINENPWRADLSAPPYSQRREDMINALANSIRENVDLDAMLEAM